MDEIDFLNKAASIDHPGSKQGEIQGHQSQRGSESENDIAHPARAQAPVRVQHGIEQWLGLGVAHGKSLGRRTCGEKEPFVAVPKM